MKTTVDIATPLLRQAKRLATERHTTLRAVIEDALREAVEKERSTQKKSSIRLVTCSGRGLRPGLSWSDWRSIIEMSYAGRGA